MPWSASGHGRERAPNLDHHLRCTPEAAAHVNDAAEEDEQHELAVAGDDPAASQGRARRSKAPTMRTVACTITGERSRRTARRGCRARGLRVSAQRLDQHR